MADNQPMWGNNQAVAPTPGATIIAVDLGYNFTMNGHHLSMSKDRQFDGRARADPHKHIAEFVKICGICHGHGLGRGTIIQIFYHGLDAATQAILAGGIFLYKTLHEAHRLLKDRVLLKLDWSKDIKAKPLRKTVAFYESSENSQLIEKIEETDIQQKDEKPSKKRQNRTRDGKVCEDESSSQLREEKAKKNVT
ncbi:hypothetical protein Tco_1062168 [Tanacetum coccineum]